MSSIDAVWGLAERLTSERDGDRCTSWWSCDEDWLTTINVTSQEVDTLDDP